MPFSSLAPRFAVRHLLGPDIEDKAWNPALHPRDARGRFIRKERKNWEPNAFAALMDPKSPVTLQVLQKRLADGEGLYADRQKWLRAINRFNKLADKGEGEKWPQVVEYLKGVKDHKLDQFEQAVKNDPPIRAAMLRAIWAERKRRSEGSAGMFHARRFAKNSEAQAWAAENWPLPEGLKNPQKWALKAYTGTDFKAMNDVLRNPNGTHDVKQVKRVKQALDAFELAKAPEDVIVFRGSPMRTLNELGLSDWHKLDSIALKKAMQGLVGKTFAPKTFHSTSIGTKAAFSHKEIQWMIRVPKGYPAMYLGDISKHKGEREVLLKPGAKRIIHAVYRNPDNPNDPRWYIEVELVPDNFTPAADWTPEPVGDAHLGYK